MTVDIPAWFLPNATQCNYLVAQKLIGELVEWEDDFYSAVRCDIPRFATFVGFWAGYNQITSELPPHRLLHPFVLAYGGRLWPVSNIWPREETYAAEVQIGAML